ncbi:MAG: zinc ribbon domain-containing protein [Treponema sp.]|nr:zinc ribbon domain-containing protein [Candidatus Treponema caballi]
MEDIFDRLKALQDVLSEKYGVEALIEEAPKELVNQESLLEQLKKEYIELNASYEETRTKVGKLKVDLAEAEAAREKGEKGMDSITTHREYEILQKEIDDATMLEQTVRKELQKEEKSMTAIDEQIKEKEQMINGQETELNEKKQALSEKTESFKAKLDDLNKQKEELEPGIDPDIIFKFERIIKSKQGKGIVAVKGNVCDGCHMILPAQFANEVRNGEKIVFCPYCSRILFYQDVPEGENEYLAMPDTGSLADDDLLEEDEDFDPDREDGADNDDTIKDLDF